MEHATGQLTHLKTRDDLRAAVRRVLDGETSRIFAVWPGAYRSDLFLIDDVKGLAAKIGVTVADD